MVAEQYTVVTDSWLQQLTGLAGLSPAIGLVGPMSNYARRRNWLKTGPYRVGPKKNLQAGGGAGWLVDVEVNSFARQRRQNKGKWLEAERLGGFCLLVKRAVLDKVGVIESEGGLGLFDTDVLSPGQAGGVHAGLLQGFVCTSLRQPDVCPRRPSCSRESLIVRVVKKGCCLRYKPTVGMRQSTF